MLESFGEEVMASKDSLSKLSIFHISYVLNVCYIVRERIFCIRYGQLIEFYRRDRFFPFS